MNFLLRTAMTLLLLGMTYAHADPSDSGEPAASEEEPSLIIMRHGSRESLEGSEEHFTGSVRVDMLFESRGPSKVTAASVTFEPGARSNWHTHPRGQHLLVTAGQGWVQEEGGLTQPIDPGDVVWTEPDVRHWHGATAESTMTHIAIQEQVDGTAVKWMERVADEQYEK